MIPIRSNDISPFKAITAGSPVYNSSSLLAPCSINIFGDNFPHEIQKKQVCFFCGRGQQTIGKLGSTQLQFH